MLHRERYDIVYDMRLVLDTDVVVAAMRSPRGASAAILKAIRSGQATLLLSVPLAMEYEAICQEAEHRVASGLSAAEANTFVTAVIAMAEPVRTHYLWRPTLRDPNDEMVLEVAINGHADALVSFNLRDYGDVPKRYGIDLLLPRDAIGRVRQ